VQPDVRTGPFSPDHRNRVQPERINAQELFGAVERKVRPPTHEPRFAAVGIARVVVELVAVVALLARIEVAVAAKRTHRIAIRGLGRAPAAAVLATARALVVRVVVAR